MWLPRLSPTSPIPLPFVSCIICDFFQLHRSSVIPAAPRCFPSCSFHPRPAHSCVTKCKTSLLSSPEMVLGTKGSRLWSLCIFMLWHLYMGTLLSLLLSFLSIRSSLCHLVIKNPDSGWGALRSSLDSAPRWKHYLEPVMSLFWASVSSFGNLRNSETPSKANFLGFYSLLIPPSLPSTTYKISGSRTLWDAVLVLNRGAKQVGHVLTVCLHHL